MGLEHLIAALGATWYIQHNEKKVKERWEKEIEREHQAEIDREIEAKVYLSKKGYNTARQRDLTLMAQSILPEDRKEFAKILGRPYLKGDAALERALRAIADKEGWLYYDENELIYDAQYCSLAGWTAPPPELTRNHFKRIEEMRANEALWQTWAENHPECFAVNISPEFYESEEAFAHVVQGTLSNRAHKNHSP